MNRLLYSFCTTVVALGLIGALTLRGQSADAVNTSDGVAVHGFDVVTYFTEGRPVPGLPSITALFAGATYRFATVDHRNAFVANPAKYVPEFGGYCAYGVSRGYAVDIDPTAFAIVDGRLYLNYSPGVQRTWNADRSTYLERARGNWPKVLADLSRR